MEQKNVIAVCCATLREISVLEPMHVICETANKLGMTVQIFQSFDELNDDTEVSHGDRSVFDLINYDMLCGMIIFSERIKSNTVIGKLVSDAHEHGLPVVSLDRKQEGCFNITFDYADAFENIVRHLVEYHGLRDFFIMAGGENNAFSEERLDVIRKVFVQYDIPLRDRDIAYGQFWGDPTKAAMEQFFASGRKLPEAFIALNDTMAIVIIDELHNRGYNVPDDTIVTGFDGIYLAEDFVPKITTAKQQFDVAAVQAVNLILAYREGREAQCHDISVPFKMMVRQSCGCEKVSMRGVNGNVRGMYLNYDDYKRFGFYMDQMTREVVADGTMDSLIDVTAGYSHFVNNHEHIFLCVKKQFLKNDEEFLQNAIRSNPSIEGSVKKDMVQLFHTVSGQKYKTELLDFEQREILPDLEMWQNELKNLVIVPVHSGETVYGYMVMDFNSNIRDLYKGRMYINRIANLMLVINQKSLLSNSNQELTTAKNQLEKMYNLDPMTGIYNRRGFSQSLMPFLATRQGGFVSLFIVDLDRLKPINDTYGHSEGDFAIKALGDSLADLIGENGVYARFGGDEFVGLLHRDKEDDDITNHLWNEMQHRLEKKREKSLKPYRIQCSLGAVQIPWTGEIDTENLFNKADKTLYEMKTMHHEQEDEMNAEAKEYTHSVLNHVQFDAFAEASDYVYIYVLDMNTGESRWSRNFVEYFGVPQEYLMHAEVMWLDHVHPDDRDIYMNDILNVINGVSKKHACQYRARNIYGEYVWVECKGTVVHRKDGKDVFAGMVTRLDNQSMYDNLTGLKTKNQLFGRSFTTGEGFVCLFSIDYYRKMVANYGYAKMNDVLVRVGKVLSGLSEQGIESYRYGDDEFICVLPGKNMDDASELFSTLEESASVYDLDNGVKFSVSFSGGAISYPIQDGSVDNIVNRLETTLTYSKSGKRGKLIFYSQEIEEKEERRKLLKKELSKSILNGFEGFELYYQPWMNENGDEIIGCEALLRWKGKKIRDSYPGEFIPLLEESNEIIEVGRFVMRQAMCQQKEWEEKYGKIMVSFNVSYNQFLVDNYVQELEETAKKLGVDPSSMVIELTESNDVESPSSLANVFEQLRKIGFNIALDDFGTGYATMEMLKKLPCDAVKIEHNFVRELANEGHSVDFAIIRTILYLCKELGHKVVVEGVENKEVDAIIKSMHAGYLQGYYYSKPVCKEDFEALLEKQER